MQAILVAVIALAAIANAQITLNCAYGATSTFTTAACKDLANICSWGFIQTGQSYNGSSSCSNGATTASCSLAVTTNTDLAACPPVTTSSAATLASVCNYIITNDDEGDATYNSKFSQAYNSGITNGTCSNSSSSTCFPASASVQLQDGTSKTMAQLEVGDKVLVGANTYSEVYFFAHRLTDALVPFVKIATSNGNTLMLTGDHYLYVNGNLAVAKTVKVGDSLIAADGSSIRVVEVSTEISTGLYNPHTMQGDIVVDGVKTSTYTSSIAPSLAHAMLWPVRMLYSLGQNIVDGAFNQGSELISALLPNGKETY